MSTPWTEFPRPVGSFQQPIPLILTEPDDDATRVVVCFSGDYVQVVLGALSQLMNQATWIADETELFEMRQRVTRLQELIAEGECVDGCCPIFQTDPATGLPEVSYDGGLTFTKFPQGEYNPDETAPYAPSPPPLNKGDDDTDKCFAAWNAAAVISEFYRQTVGAVAADTFNAVLAVNQFLYQLNQSLLRLIYPSEAQLAQALGFFNFDFGEYATAPTLSDETMADLRCLLLANASESVDGIVTFDFDAVHDTVISALGLNPGAAVLLLLDYMDRAGLDASGGVQSNETADCESCDTGWCYRLDLEASDEYTEPYPGQAEYSAGNGYTHPTGSNTNHRTVIINFPATANVTRVDLIRSAPIDNGGQNAARLYQDVGGAPVQIGGDLDANNLLTTFFGFSVDNSKWYTAEFSNVTGAGGPPVPGYLTAIIFYGEGDNPFGDDNC